MKIELEVPDELVGDEPLWLFSGMNHIAVKRPDADWVVKDGHCSMCGRCCSASHLKGMNLKIKDGVCASLTDHPTEEGKKVCGLGKMRPFICLIAQARFTPQCTVTWKC